MPAYHFYGFMGTASKLAKYELLHYGLNVKKLLTSCNAFYCHPKDISKDVEKSTVKLDAPKIFILPPMLLT